MALRVCCKICEDEIKNVYQVIQYKRAICVLFLSFEKMTSLCYRVATNAVSTLPQ